MSFSDFLLVCTLLFLVYILYTQTPEWRRAMNKLARISGSSYSIDARRGIARCSCKVDPYKRLRAIEKAEKHADLLWDRHGSSMEDNQSIYQNVYRTTGMGYYDDDGLGSYGGGGYYDHPNYHHDPYMYGPRSGYNPFNQYHQDPYMYGPRSGYNPFNQYHQDPYMYGPRSGYNPFNQYHQDPYFDYRSHPPYHQPEAMYFPQSPPPIKNPRTVGYLSWM